MRIFKYTGQRRNRLGAGLRMSSPISPRSTHIALCSACASSMKVHFLRVVIIHQHWREDGCGQGVVVEDGGAGKTLGCRANARNVREATHAPSEPSKPIPQSWPPLIHPLGHAGSRASPSPPASSTALLSPSFTTSPSFFPTFFYPNSTLTHRKMPIRNVSSEKEKLKLATIFFHAGSRCLPFSLSRCISISVAPMLRHCFISFFAHFSLEMSRRAFMSCAPLPQTQAAEVGRRGRDNDTGRADSSALPSPSRGFQFTRLRPAHPFSVCPSS